MDELENQEPATEETQLPTEGTDAQSADASSAEGASAESDVSPEDQENDFSKDVVKDNEGKEFVPKEVLVKRLASLTAKRKEAEEMLETLRSNPEARAQFLKEVEGKAEVAKAESETSEEETSETPGWTNLTNWFSKLSAKPEHQAFYREQMTALISDLNPMLEHVIQSRLSAALAPFKKYIGETTIKSFSDKNKDFSKYEQAVYKKMKDTGMSHEDAYKSIKHDDLVKEIAALKGGGKTPSPTSQQREKLKQTPITKRAPTSIGKPKSGAGSLDEAIADSMKELNWGK